MAWLQLHIATDPDHADAFQDALEALGAGAVTLTDGADQPVFEPPPGARPLWRTTVVTALFSDDTDTDAILARLGEQGLVFADHRVEALADQAWERAWMDDFQPMRFGERLWIVPSWSDPPQPDAVNLKLDPGLAFGTGTHDTTALCLEWLEQTDLDGKQVLDFGCGSGVLAIAALLLGAERALGTDIDHQALTASADNAAANGVGPLPPGRADGAVRHPRRSGAKRARRLRALVRSQPHPAARRLGAGGRGSQGGQISGRGACRHPLFFCTTNFLSLKT